MDSLAIWFANTLGQYVSKEFVIFFISMVPILELRGGLLAASLIGVPITTAVPICIVGNIIPIPFILLFIKQIFKLLKKVKIFKGLIVEGFAISAGLAYTVVPSVRMARRSSALPASQPAPGTMRTSSHSQ